MAKLTAYPEATRFDTNDILIKDGVNGTKKIKAANAAIDFISLISSTNHRNVFRGKNLGDSVTNDQRTAISNGSFDGLFIGDYWLINDIKWVIADMDYWYHSGDTEFLKHHLVIIPDNSLYNSVMNDSDTTSGGYVGSKMYTENLNQAKTLFNTVFGNLVLSHREYFITDVNQTSGHPSSGGWFDSTVDLMNEIMVYGCIIRGYANDGQAVTHTNSRSQLALFRLNPQLAYTNMSGGRYSTWLRDVSRESQFAYVSSTGMANSALSSVATGVRPVAAIGVV